MSDQIKGFWVALDRDMKDEDAAGLREALLRMRGVAAVEMKITDPNDWFARQRVRQDIAKKIVDILYGRDQ